jgi:hypothetical protein
MTSSIDPVLSPLANDTEISVLDELWKIFTFYTMNTNALSPEHLKVIN